MAYAPEILSEGMLHVLSLLESVNHYPYHNIVHTLDVYHRTMYICSREGITGDFRMLLLLAALFHDTGFVIQYTENELVGASLARKYLESQHVAETDIRTVEQCILSTVLFSRANNLAERIIQDADLDNIGRRDAISKTILMYHELHFIGRLDISARQWLETTRHLLKRFRFHTETSRAERDAIREVNISLLEALLRKVDTEGITDRWSGRGFPW